MKPQESYNLNLYISNNMSPNVKKQTYGRKEDKYTNP